MPMHCTGVGKALLAFGPPEHLSSPLVWPVAPAVRTAVLGGVAVLRGRRD